MGSREKEGGRRGKRRNFLEEVVVHSAVLTLLKAHLICVLRHLCITVFQVS